jgi:hypothetical protein
VRQWPCAASSSERMGCWHVAPVYTTSNVSALCFALVEQMVAVWASADRVHVARGSLAKQVCL